MKEVSIDILRTVSFLIVKDEDMAMPFPDAMTRVSVITVHNTDAVATDGDRLTRVRFQRFFTFSCIGSEDDLDDLCFERGFFPSEFAASKSWSGRVG